MSIDPWGLEVYTGIYESPLHIGFLGKKTMIYAKYEASWENAYLIGETTQNSFSEPEINYGISRVEIYISFLNSEVSYREEIMDDNGLIKRIWTIDWTGTVFKKTTPIIGVNSWKTSDFQASRDFIFIKYIER